MDIYNIGQTATVSNKSPKLLQAELVQFLIDSLQPQEESCVNADKVYEKYCYNRTSFLSPNAMYTAFEAIAQEAKEFGFTLKIIRQNDRVFFFGVTFK
ncbi:hypothetical protein NIES4106_61820 (plasmid) [Fischerella sp. NIES-4106]|nr:hypothetical protein NIES4106_61820 [Fischerella sp. NIES-4106]